MNISSPEQYQESLRNAPESVREAVTSNATWDAFSEIIQRYGLSEKRNKIGDLVTEVFAGFLPIRIFVKELQAHASVTPDTAPLLARDIRSALFMPVAKELSAVQQHAEQTYAQTQQGAPDEGAASDIIPR